MPSCKRCGRDATVTTQPGRASRSLLGIVTNTSCIIMWRDWRHAPPVRSVLDNGDRELNRDALAPHTECFFVGKASPDGGCAVLLAA